MKLPVIASILAALASSASAADLATSNRAPSPLDGRTAMPAYQQAAMAARYGMWATYVLDMAEWRRKAVDRTASRQPLADFNLLAERQSEISPPFVDARNKPKRTDR